MQCDIAIVGGGLAGLALADHLARAGADFQVFEARNRLGGRVVSHHVEDFAFDLGPSWFWPGQPRMAALCKRFGITWFDQHSVGSFLLETETGDVKRDMGLATMQASWRIEGGSAAVVEALAVSLPKERLHLGQVVRSMSQAHGITFADGSQCYAQKIVLAVPPRVAAQLSFAPALSERQQTALDTIPTWMAAHAKFFAVYDRPFWRAAGLSGDAISRKGPLAEIHDASAADGTPAALLGFVGVPATVRQADEAGLKSAAVAQLVALFGPEAAAPREIILKDWAFEALTAGEADRVPPSHHPTYGLPEALTDLWGGGLHFCVTETAPICGGFMEGALAAAEDVAAKLL